LTPSPPPDIYTLSLHDALPISSPNEICLTTSLGRVKWTPRASCENLGFATLSPLWPCCAWSVRDSQPGSAIRSAEDTATGCLSVDRKSTRLNSSHLVISYAVFC